MKVFLTALFISCFFVAEAADPHYSAKIKRTHSHLDCIYFDIEIWSDNGTPADPNDDYVVGTGTISKCGDYVNNPPSSPTTSTSYFIEPSTSCLIFEVTILNNEGNPYAEGAIADDNSC